MKDKVLIFFTIFLVFLFPLSFLIEKKQNFIKTYETSFLNPENDKEIEKIIVETPETSLILKNEGGFFTGNSNEKNCAFPADQKIVENFIQILKKIRKITKAESSGTILNEKNYEFKISYQLKNGKTTSILVGKTDITETKRFVKIPSSSGTFKTEADFSPFLTTSADFWVCPEIVWNFGNSKVSSEQIQKISLIKNGKRKTLIPSSKDFIKKAETVISLRHGKICPKPEISENQEFLEVEFSDSRLLLKIIPFKEDYILTYKNKHCDFSAEISGWTYGRLMEVFSES